MPTTDISSAVASDLTNTMTDYSVDSVSTDAPTGQKEFEWMNTHFNEWFGYYKKIPELSVIDAKATWTVGKGIKADEITTMLLDTIKGNGFDTFNTILENMIITYNIGGDSYCEIIRDKEDNLINIKPLDPSVMKHISNKQGMLIRFEQVSKVEGKKPKTFKPEEIFYLPRNRVADEVHGQSMIEKLIEIILMKNEAMADYKKVLHRNVAPLWIFHLDTDDTTKINAFKTKFDNARKDGENMYIPKDVVVPEMVSTAANAIMNPITWIDSLDAKFYEAAQVPKIIVGGAGGYTEAAVKIAYLAFQQTIEEEQLFIEEQVLAQLNLLIELEFPASLENELLSDNEKDATSGAAQPNETTAGSGQ